ncbi:hypothetical protein RQP46_002726 [Phenoliferia psychrophenolica]
MLHLTTSLSLFATLFVAAALPPAGALPKPAGSAILHGRARRSTRIGGSNVFDRVFVADEINRLAFKYKVAGPRLSMTKRGSGSVPLTDERSADLWVPGLLNTCFSESFISLASSSFTPTPTPFRIQYGSGSVLGSVSIDTVSVAGLTVEEQGFGDVVICSSQFQGSPAGGILGLGFASIANSGQTPVIENLIAQKKLDENLFAFSLTRGLVNGSTLTIGRTDPSKYTGEIQYTPVTSQTYWQIAAEAPLVNGKPVGTGYQAAIDTGTTLIYMPTSIAERIYEAIPGSSRDSGDSFQGTSFWQYPCDANFSVALTFAGLPGSFDINLRDFDIGLSSANSTLCVGGIVGQDLNDQAGNPLSIVGDEMSPSSSFAVGLRC